MDSVIIPIPAIIPMHISGQPVELIIQISSHKRKNFSTDIPATHRKTLRNDKKIWLERNKMQAFPVEIKNHPDINSLERFPPEIMLQLANE